MSPQHLYCDLFGSNAAIAHVSLDDARIWAISLRGFSPQDVSYAKLK